MNIFLEKNVAVKITSPIGSSFKKNKIYLNNYGVAEGVNAHVLGVYKPIKEYCGKVIGVLKGEVNELIVAKEISDFSKEQIEALLAYYVDFSKTKVITLEYLAQHIRNSARAIIKEGDKYLLVRQTYLEEEYFHLVGGGMNFLEEPHIALGREIKEELEANLIDYKHITTISNIFSVKKIKAHEIMHLYECKISKTILNSQLITADIYTSELVWLSVEEINELKEKILPKAIPELILKNHLS